jgi:hypothetical protein
MEQNRRDFRRIAQVQAASNLEAPSATEDPSVYKYDADDGEVMRQRRARAVADEEAQRELLALAAREQRDASKRMRELRGGPVAFDIKPADEATVEREEGMKRHPSAYDRGVKVVTESMAGGVDNKLQEVEPAVVDRQRKGWGVPVNLNQISNDRLPLGSHDDEPIEESKGTHIKRSETHHLHWRFV